VRKRKPCDSELTLADFTVPDMISTYLINVAKHSDPNGRGVTEWPQLREQNHEVMYSHDKIYPETVPGVDGLEMIDAYFT